MIHIFFEFLVFSKGFFKTVTAITPHISKIPILISYVSEQLLTNINQYKSESVKSGEMPFKTRILPLCMEMGQVRHINKALMMRTFFEKGVLI